MTRNVTLTTLGLLATIAASSLSPALADGQRSRQQTDKNNARNIAIAGAAVAVYGLLHHNSAATVLGAAGAVLGGSQYEKDRKQQSQDNNGRGDYYRNDHNDNGVYRGDYSGRDYNTDRSDNGDRYDYRGRNGNTSDRSRDTSGWSQGRGHALDARPGNGGNGRQWTSGDRGPQQYRGSRNGDNNRDTHAGNYNRDSDQDTDARWNGDSRTHDR